MKIFYLSPEVALPRGTLFSLQKPMYFSVFRKFRISVLYGCFSTFFRRSVIYIGGRILSVRLLIFVVVVVAYRIDDFRCCTLLFVASRITRQVR